MSQLSPSTFLDLVQRMSLECQLAGDPPSTVTGATGETLTLAMWIANAWTEIQTKYTDWAFMLQSPGASFTTVAAQTSYTPTQAGVPLGVSSWKKGTFRSYLTATGTPAEIRMTWVPYDTWRDAYNIGALRTSQVQPVIYSIHPNQQNILIQCPLAGYTITNDYFLAPTTLAADADVSLLPAQFTLAIVGQAMMNYGMSESSAEVFKRGEGLYNRYMNKLEMLRLPELGTGSPIA